MKRPFFLIVLLLSGLLPSCATSKTPKADKIIVSKRCKYMFLMKNGKVLKRYHVAMGRNRLGHKQMEGDFRTPEGTYCISERKFQSQFYKALRVSYPNDQDVQRASVLGVPPGGDIMIHGVAPHHAKRSDRYLYTRGCIALANSEMDEVWSMVEPGTPIEIRP